MCGRINLRTNPRQLALLFDVHTCPDFEVRYNIAPTQDVLVTKVNQTGEREIVPMRWGLIPSWSTKASISSNLFNARSETVAEKPSFRTAYQHRRCLIPVSGFYEWSRQGKEKKPYHVHHRSDYPFALAGLWEHWSHADSSVTSCTILTTAANTFMQPLHDRMPVLIRPDDFSLWLDTDTQTETLRSLTDPCEWTDFITTPVGQTVNNARNETPACIQPASAPPRMLF